MTECDFALKSQIDTKRKKHLTSPPSSTSSPLLNPVKFYYAQKATR